MVDSIKTVGSQGTAVSNETSIKPARDAASPASSVVSELSASCQGTLNGILKSFAGGASATAFGSAQAAVYGVGKAFAHLPERVREELVTIAKRTFPHREDMQNKMIADLTTKLDGDPVIEAYRKNQA